MIETVKEPAKLATVVLKFVDGAIFFKEIHAFPEAMRAWADTIQEVIFEMYNPDDCEIEVDDNDLSIDVTQKKENWRISVDAKRFVFRIIECKIAELPNLLDRLKTIANSIFEVIGPTRIYVDIYGNRYVVEIPIQEKNADTVFWNTFVNKEAFANRHKEKEGRTQLELKDVFLSKQKAIEYSIEVNEPESLMLTFDVQTKPEKSAVKFNQSLLEKHFTSSSRQFLEDFLEPLVGNPKLAKHIDMKAFVSEKPGEESE